jgi:hypothetical protein
MRPEGLSKSKKKKKKKINDLIGIRIHAPQACSIAPQPPTLQRDSWIVIRALYSPTVQKKTCFCRMLS